MKSPNRDQMTVAPDGRPMEDQPAWRNDFPIDWPQDHYIARRDFTKFMVLTSFAFTVGQVWIVFQNLFNRSKNAQPVLQIAKVEQLPVGGSLTFAYPEKTDTCILIRPEENTFLAFSQKCTHLSCAVVPEPDNGRFFCPCHEGAFELKTGRPIAGPPRRPLPRIKLDFHNGLIFAVGVEETTF